jgi:hypothetical protein
MNLHRFLFGVLEVSKLPSAHAVGAIPYIGCDFRAVAPTTFGDNHTVPVQLDQAAWL